MELMKGTKLNSMLTRNKMLRSRIFSFILRSNLESLTFILFIPILLQKEKKEQSDAPQFRCCKYTYFSFLFYWLFWIYWYLISLPFFSKNGRTGQQKKDRNYKSKLYIMPNIYTRTFKTIYILFIEKKIIIDTLSVLLYKMF